MFNGRVLKKNTVLPFICGQKTTTFLHILLKNWEFDLNLFGFLLSVLILMLTCSKLIVLNTSTVAQCVVANRMVLDTIPTGGTNY